MEPQESEGAMDRGLVDEYRARARAERASAAALGGLGAADASSAMADRFDRVADAYERLIDLRQSTDVPSAGRNSAA